MQKPEHFYISGFSLLQFMGILASLGIVLTLIYEYL